MTLIGNPLWHHGAEMQFKYFHIEPPMEGAIPARDYPFAANCTFACACSVTTTRASMLRLQKLHHVSVRTASLHACMFEKAS